MPLFRFLYLALAIVLFYSCTKEELQQDNDHRLSKIIITSNDSIKTINFFYDLQGRLISLEDSNSQSHINRRLNSYNSENRLFKSTSFNYFGSKSNLIGQSIDSFSYDVATLKTKRYNVVIPSGVARHHHTYVYDGQGRVLFDSVYSYWSSDVFAYSKFDYDQNNNLVQFERTDKFSGAFVSSGVTKITYSASKNPFYALRNSLYIFNDFYLFPLSPYLPTKMTDALQRSTNFSYEYYSNGQLHKITETSGTNNSWVLTTELFYE